MFNLWATTESSTESDSKNFPRISLGAFDGRDEATLVGLVELLHCLFLGRKPEPAAVSTDRTGSAKAGIQESASATTSHTSKVGNTTKTSKDEICHKNLNSHKVRNSEV